MPETPTIDAALLAKSIMLLIMPTALFTIHSIAEINTLPMALPRLAKNCGILLAASLINIQPVAKVLI